MTGGLSRRDGFELKNGAVSQSFGLWTRENQIFIKHFLAKQHLMCYNKGPGVLRQRDSCRLCTERHLKINVL